MNCWHCKTELIWGSDSTHESDEFDMISFLTCPNCESEVEVYHKKKSDQPQFVAFLFQDSVSKNIKQLFVPYPVKLIIGKDNKTPLFVQVQGGLEGTLGDGDSQVQAKCSGFIQDCEELVYL